MPLRSALIPLLLLPASLPHGHARVDVRHVDGWTLTVRTDAFSEGRTCRLTAHGMEYLRGALVVHLPRRVNTVDAVYRVDGGEPVAAASEQLALARLGFAIHRDDLANPSGGLVIIPEARVLDAHRVRIQPTRASGAYGVRVEGLGAAVDSARAAGCGPSAFIPGRDR